MESLAEMMQKTVVVATNDGRLLLGTLCGLDQTTNIILDKSIERIFSEEGVIIESLGLYIVRGDNIAVIGELDEELDGMVQWEDVKVGPMPSFLHHLL